MPVLHSSAAMLKIAEMDYTGANSIFLRILFDKKYALPYRVVDSVVFHFIRYVIFFYLSGGNFDKKILVLIINMGNKG